MVALIAISAESSKTRYFGGSQGQFGGGQGQFGGHRPGIGAGLQGAGFGGAGLGGAYPGALSKPALGSGLQGGYNGGLQQGGFSQFNDIAPLPPPIPGGGYGGVSDTCRYWCKTNVGKYYCCEGGLQPEGLVGTKPGECVPARPSCPRFRAPQICSNDGACAGIDKCCFDTCLQEHVCKPPKRGTY